MTSAPGPRLNSLTHPSSILTLLVCAAAAGRSLVAWQHPTPVFFPDEIIYSSLARGIAETGMPRFLGHSMNFPAVLTAYLTAPLWLLSNTTLAYHLVQSEGALAFSLAAVPIYWVARRLSLPVKASLLLAAGTLALPDLALSSLLLSEPYAFLLFALTFWAGHRALLSATSVGDQLLFICLLALLILTRAQFVILPAAYLFALVVQGLGERTLRKTLRAQLPLLVVFLLPVPVAAVIGFTRLFGFYNAIGDYLTPTPAEFFHWLLLNLLVLALSCGWLLAPGAALGIMAILRRPRDRAERAFALLLAPILLGQLAQATIIATQVEDAQGRYLIYLLPLLLIQFALTARRGILTSWQHALFLLALIPIALLAPIFELNRTSLNSAPILLSRYKLEEAIGIPDTYASIPFLLSGLTVVALFAWWKHSQKAMVVLIAGFMVAASVGGIFGQHLLATKKVSALHRPLQSASKAERSLLLVSKTTESQRAMSTVFWNREISRVVSLAPPRLGVLPVDAIAAGPDGTLLVDGVPHTGSLVVDQPALNITLHGVKPTCINPNVCVFLSTGAPVQLRTLVSGLLGAGLSRTGTLRAWPAEANGLLSGEASLSLSLPANSAKKTVVVFRLPQEPTRTVTIEPGKTRNIRLRISSRGVWRASFSARGGQYRSEYGFPYVQLQHLRFRFADATPLHAE